MASAGRILIMPKGNYDSSATYEMLDLVNHNGASWLAKKTATGLEPSNANSEYWHPLLVSNALLVDTTGNVKTSLKVENGALILVKEVNGVESGRTVVAQIP